MILNNHMSYVMHNDLFLKGIWCGCRTLKLPVLDFFFLTVLEAMSAWAGDVQQQMEKRGAVVIAGPYYLFGVWCTILCHWRGASGLAFSRSNPVYVHYSSPGNQGESRPVCWYRSGLCWKVSPEMDTSAGEVQLFSLSWVYLKLRVTKLIRLVWHLELTCSEAQLLADW